MEIATRTNLSQQCGIVHFSHLNGPFTSNTRTSPEGLPFPPLLVAPFLLSCWCSLASHVPRCADATVEVARFGWPPACFRLFFVAACFCFCFLLLSSSSFLCFSWFSTLLSSHDSSHTGDTAVASETRTPSFEDDRQPRRCRSSGSVHTNRFDSSLFPSQPATPESNHSVKGSARLCRTLGLSIRHLLSTTCRRPVAMSSSRSTLKMNSAVSGSPS